MSVNIMICFSYTPDLNQLPYIYVRILVTHNYLCCKTLYLGYVFTVFYIKLSSVSKHHDLLFWLWWLIPSAILLVLSQPTASEIKL